jgi:hypothetical protein
VLCAARERCTELGRKGARAVKKPLRDAPSFLMLVTQPGRVIVEFGTDLSLTLARRCPRRAICDNAVASHELDLVTRLLFAIPLALSAGVLATGAQKFGLAAARRAPSPTILELYQSQGCSSCPPALEVLREEADRPGIIALNFSVTYWDNLGWKDSFAQPAFTSRQWDYARANGRSEVATPQLIVDGRVFLNGGSKAEVDAAIERTRMPPRGPTIDSGRGQLTVGSAPTGLHSTVWLVSYDPRTLQVPIRSGENRGRTLPHRNIVRAIERLGSWTGLRRTFLLPQSRQGLSRVVLVQTGPGGPVIAAKAIS